MKTMLYMVLLLAAAGYHGFEAMGHTGTTNEYGWTTNEYVDHKGGVSCGCHAAPSCRQCGTQPHMCNGDCTWDLSGCNPKGCPARTLESGTILQKDNRGIKLCLHEKHVHEECRCGKELCNIGDSCVGDFCHKKRACPPGYHNGLENKKKSQGKENFRVVPIHSTGAMVKVQEAEIESNTKEILELLKKCDIAKLDDGFIEGRGYSKNIIKGNCVECTSKIVRIEDPPNPHIYNKNVAEHCCFIIWSNNNTYVLTSHSALGPLPHDNCSSHCSYTLFQDLLDNDPAHHCLSEIENPTCCSKTTGALCDNYGEEIKLNKDNVEPNGTCSNICKSIADCSSDKKNDWCINIDLIKDNQEHGFDANLTDLFWLPEYCTPIVPEPAKQFAIVHPKALPTTLRGDKTCGAWHFWILTCQQGFNYNTYQASKNYYRIDPHLSTYHFFKHPCCKAILGNCITFVNKPCDEDGTNPLPCDEYHDKPFDTCPSGKGGNCNFDTWHVVLDDNVENLKEIDGNKNNILTYEACQSKCASKTEDECKIWMFHKKTHMCTMMTKFENTDKNDDVIFGPRDCPKSSG